MTDNVEAPYLDASISAEWKVDLPNDVEPNNLLSEAEMEKALVDQLDLGRESIVEGTTSVSVNYDVTWGSTESDEVTKE